MNSMEKWRELEESKDHDERQKTIAQNGNSGKNYKQKAGQLSFDFSSCPSHHKEEDDLI